MSDVDYYVLSRLLGAKMHPIKMPTFGPFGILQTMAEVAKVRYAPEKARPHFTVHEEKLVVRSFEKVRAGLPPDALLWNSTLVKRFLAACRKRGLDFAQADLVRRLLCIRKNPKKYAERGIILAPTTKKKHYPSILAAHAPVIEFSLVRLRYRHGSSIDEILIDPILGEEFETVVRDVLPTLPSSVIRKSALTLRKSRFLPKSRRQELRRLTVARLEPQWSSFQSLASMKLASVPSIPGIVEVRDARRDLYISRNENLQGVLRMLAERDALSIMGSPFWKPDLNEIEARFIPDSAMDTADLERWEWKLLCEQAPVFNWPITKPKRAA